MVSLDAKSSRETSRRGVVQYPAKASFACEKLKFPFHITEECLHSPLLAKYKAAPWVSFERSALFFLIPIFLTILLVPPYPPSNVMSPSRSRLQWFVTLDWGIRGSPPCFPFLTLGGGEGVSLIAVHARTPRPRALRALGLGRKNYGAAFSSGLRCFLVQKRKSSNRKMPNLITAHSTQHY